MNNSFSMLGKIAELTETLAKEPRSTVFVSLAEAYRQMGLLDDALEIAAKGTRSLPNFGPGYLTVGRILIQKGQLEDAAQALESALHLDGDNLPALKNLGRIRLKQGDKNRAGDLLRKAAGLKPDDPEIAKLLKVCGPAKVNEAPSGAPAGTAKSSAKAAPISTPTLAEIYIRQGFYKKAMRIFLEILKNDPGNSEIRRSAIALKRRMEMGENQDSPVEESSREVTDSGSAAPVESAPTAIENGPRQIFEKWLEAIQIRREDVQ